jgi:hypothetical protein
MRVPYARAIGLRASDNDAIGHHVHEIAPTYPKTDDRFGETLSWELPNLMNSD